MGRWIVAIVIAGAMALPATANAQEPQSFASCADLRAHIDAMKPYETLRLAPSTFTCKEPLNPAADGLRIDFGDSLVRVADQALRPGIVVGDLQTPPATQARQTPHHQFRKLSSDLLLRKVKIREPELIINSLRITRWWNLMPLVQLLAGSPEYRMSFMTIKGNHSS
jgi:hypothetical protein